MELKRAFQWPADIFEIRCLQICIPHWTFFCGLHCDVFSVWPMQRQTVGRRMNNELEMNWREAIVASTTHYPNICLEGLRKYTKDLIQDNRCPVRYSNRIPSEYKYIELQFRTPPPNSLIFIFIYCSTNLSSQKQSYVCYKAIHVTWIALQRAENCSFPCTGTVL